MNKAFSWGLLVFLTSAVTIAQAQTTPHCATADASILFRSNTPPFGAIDSTTEILMGIRQYEQQTGGAWDFPPQDVVVSGSNITADAPGVSVFGSEVPYTMGSLGILPAGTYTITIRPIATNVTPNVVCPTFNVPLVVPQAYEYVPVPVLAGSLAFLLSLLVGIIGTTSLRRRRIR